MSPYDDVEPALLAKAELDALPKDSTHPFAELSRDQARAIYNQYVAQRSKEIADARQKTPPKNKTAEEVLNERVKLPKLLDAYRAKVASEKAKGKDKDDLRAQETRLLTEVNE